MYESIHINKHKLKRDVCMYITFPARWRRRSTPKEMETITEQTRATTHVGVYSKVVPPPAIFATVILDFLDTLCSALYNELIRLAYIDQVFIFRFSNRRSYSLQRVCRLLKKGSHSDR